MKSARRSQRVSARVRAKVHVALHGTPTTFEVTTLSVNSTCTHCAAAIFRPIRGLCSNTTARRSG